jgi:hypothetical protein
MMAKSFWLMITMMVNNKQQGYKYGERWFKVCKMVVNVATCHQVD